MQGPPTRKVRSARIVFEQSYRRALQRHAKKSGASTAADRIGRRAVELDLDTLALARVHERAASSLTVAAKTTVRGAATASARHDDFYRQAVVPLEEVGRGADARRSAADQIAKRLARSLQDRKTLRVRIEREVEQRRHLRADLTASRRARQECARQATAMERHLRRLSHELLSAQERERMKISRDLHDAIGEALTGINVGLATLQTRTDSNSRELSETIAITQELVSRSMRSVHRFAWELRPPLLDNLGLGAALRSYAKAFSERTGTRVVTTLDRHLHTLDDDQKTALFRVAQGALSNVERHARADSVRLSLKSTPKGVRLDIKDDGRSFPEKQVTRSHSSRSMGLQVMRERVAALGGTLDIDSSPGRGTRVRAQVPLTREARD